MNQWPVPGSGEAALNVRVWVQVLGSFRASADPKLAPAHVGRVLKGAVLLAALASAAAAHAAETVRYKYDARGRLVRAERTGVPGHDYKREYQYDRANNRKLKRTTPP